MAGMVEAGYDEQISKYTEHNKSHCWIKYLQVGEGKGYQKLCGIVLELGVLV